VAVCQPALNRATQVPAPAARGEGDVEETVVVEANGCSASMLLAGWLDAPAPRVTATQAGNMLDDGLRRDAAQLRGRWLDRSPQQP
jgi:hypothetical protein